MQRRTASFLITVLVGFALVSAIAYAQDPLPSWNDGPAKPAIMDFVRTTTDQASTKFVPPEARIATFDQDGTLWVEHPMYSQVLYCLERVPAVVKAKPELAKVEPFKTVLSGNREAMAKLSMQDLEKILAATLTGCRWTSSTRKRRSGSRRPGSALEAALHRTHVPADAGSAAVPPRQRLQDVHRHWRRPGLCARVRRSRPMASRPSRWSAPPVGRSTAIPRAASRF